MSLLILSESKYKQFATDKFKLIGGGIIFTAAVLLMSLTACGLPSYAYLYPPTDVKSRLNPEGGEYDLIFKNAYENNTSIFMGYEIYYKIYDPLDSDTSDTLYITDRDAINTTAGVGGNTLLENRKFTRLYTTTSNDSSFIHNSNEPAFSIESVLLDEDFNIRLFLDQEQPSGNSFIAETYESSVTFTDTPYLYRYVVNGSLNTTSKKLFDINDFDINDSDMPDSIIIDSFTQSSNSGGYYLYISFYILSYGKNPDDIAQSIYSIPVYLGTLKFDSNLTNN